MSVDHEIKPVVFGKPLFKLCLPAQNFQCNDIAVRQFCLIHRAQLVENMAGKRRVRLGLLFRNVRQIIQRHAGQEAGIKRVS